MPATVMVFAEAAGGQSPALVDREGKKVMAKTNHLGALAAAVGATLVAVGLLVVVMLVVEVHPAEATFPGKNGKIAYVGETSKEGPVIYTINVGGGARFNVTNDKMLNFSPSWQRQQTLPNYFI